MKKIILLTLIFCGLVFSQTARQKLIVSVSGELPLDMADALMNGVSYGIGKNPNNIYDVMVNDRQFKESLKNEWKGGNVSDDKIMNLAKSAGADFLCFAKINSVSGLKGKQVVTELINLNSSPMITVKNGMVTIKDEFEDLEHLTNIFLKVVEDMLGTGSGGKQATSSPSSFTGSRSSSSISNVSGSFITDSRDGQKYRIVKIGGQTWMAENLSYKAIDSECYDDSELNCQKYGRLYDWETAKKACPSGWHLPSKAEWDDLVQAVGKRIAGKRLKAKSGWNNGGVGTDEFGFTALPGGCTNSNGKFVEIGYYGYWWSATGDLVGLASSRDIQYYCGISNSCRYNKSELFSVRCIKNM
jgi:uncharacterized protein (TIGR02145 family)